jgi:hypothetical protein
MPVYSVMFISFINVRFISAINWEEDQRGAGGGGPTEHGRFELKHTNTQTHL